MEIYQIKNVTFTYPNSDVPALSDIDVSILPGEFITLCGKSGCGKTTLLRLLKSVLTPAGNLSGSISFQGTLLAETDIRTQASQIGFVMQSPEHQIVTDKVWHELAFGLESLGYDTPEIRTRVSEMAAFFGIQTWFHQSVNTLSGGQKQLLNLAAVMVMQPSVLILDEPTSQLDPIAAQEFLKTLERINRELGTTVILSEHRLEEALPLSDRVIVLEDGKIIADAAPAKAGEILRDCNHEMYQAFPVPLRVWGAVKNELDCPLTVREGRSWLEAYTKEHPLCPVNTEKKQLPPIQPVIEMREVWFRYDKALPDVIKGLQLQVSKGELFAIVGGNGTGKTTALSLMSGLHQPYRGSVLLNGKKLSEIPELYHGVLGVLPQNPQALFVKKTVFLDLMEMLSDTKLQRQEKEERLKQIAALCRIEGLLERHPYDLSGGEQQRAALAKILLQCPQILLMDEPTKGMDAPFKEIFADILDDLKASGVTIVMVSHDIGFCAAHADRCGMFFDGSITSVDTPREFFAGKSFYTTAANRMARTLIKNAVLAEDIIQACGGRTEEKEKHTASEVILPPKENIPAVKQNMRPGRIIAGCFFAVLFVLTCVFGMDVYTDWRNQAVQLLTMLELMACAGCFLPKSYVEIVQQPRQQRKLSRRTLFALLITLIAVPLTMFVGSFYLQDRKYYFISLLMILETLIPFCVAFESRKPQARELIVISVLCGIAVAGRAAFFMLPQFKPMAAIVIIAGVCFGGEAGFLVGTVAGFVSNFFFGQGPWTVWQMFCFGLVGLAAGLLFRKGWLRKTKGALCIFGFIATLVLYGGIVNLSSLMMWNDKITAALVITYYAQGFPFDLIHAASTVCFLWILGEPMVEKLERIKLKYGLLQ